MTRFTEQTEGAQAWNDRQREAALAANRELLARFEASGLSLRAFATREGMTPQALSKRLGKARGS